MTRVLDHTGPEILAAPRDASWWSQPDTRSVKVLHILGKKGTYGGINGRCGIQMLYDEMACPAQEVPPGLRCRRRGCREGFRQVEQEKPA